MDHPSAFGNPDITNISKKQDVVDGDIKKIETTANRIIQHPLSTISIPSAWFQAVKPLPDRVNPDSFPVTVIVRPVNYPTDVVATNGEFAGVSRRWIEKLAVQFSTPVTGLSIAYHPEFIHIYDRLNSNFAIFNSSDGQPVGKTGIGGDFFALGKISFALTGERAKFYDIHYKVRIYPNMNQENATPIVSESMNRQLIDGGAGTYDATLQGDPIQRYPQNYIQELAVWVSLKNH